MPMYSGNIVSESEIRYSLISPANREIYRSGQFNITINNDNNNKNKQDD